MNRIPKHFMILSLLFILITTVFIGCAIKQEQSFDISTINSFREIPGITEQEIKEIEALQNKIPEFSYGCLYSTEAFHKLDGNLTGFAISFSQILSHLFDIPFTPALYDWTTLKNGIDEKAIDFSSDFIPTPERHLVYHMSHPVAQRTLGVFTYGDEIRLESEFSLNGLRIGFLEGSVHARVVAETYPTLDFSVVNVQHTDEGISRLKSGEIDAYVMESVEKIIFAEVPEIKFWEVIPLVYNPVSLTTANPDFKVIIDVVDKFIAAGGIYHLHELYITGNLKYAKHVLHLSFTEQQKAFLSNLAATGAKIPVALEHDTYPICFYNHTDREFQGIAPDILRQISLLTGIEFEVVTESDTPFHRMLEMLNTGEAALVSELLYTDDRAPRFLWSDPYYTSRFALLSRIELPFLEMYQVESYRVGVSKGTAYDEMYNLWFRGNSNLIYFNSHIEAINALENGEIDLIMASEKTMIMLTNWLELNGYKVNILFTTAEASHFGFGLEHEVLRSIITSAQKYVDVEQSVIYWSSRYFDYNRILEQQRNIYSLNVLIIILTTVLFVLVALIYVITKNRALIRRQSMNLETALTDAKRADQAKTNFLATISHEMRTPMNAVIGIAQIELQKGNLPLETENAFEKIHSSGIGLLGIIDDILDLVKIETGKIEICPIEYNLADMIYDTVQLNVVRIGAKAIELKLDIDENLPLRLVGDELRIKQILINLLSNAIKYTEKGYVKLTVNYEIAGQARNDVQTHPLLLARHCGLDPQSHYIYLNFTVEDTGQGMKPEDKERLFTEYLRFNTEANRTVEGTGIGLTITRKLVELMDGQITIESEYGKGSTFNISIKQQIASSDKIGLETAEKLKQFTYEKDGTGQVFIVHDIMPYGKVLIVDDVDTNLYVAEGLLIPYQINVETVNSGFKALEKIYDGAVYDIIFMDHMMPVMDGIETTVKIRELGYDGTIIALTANALVGNDEMFKQNGFDGFVSKPIDMRHLDAVLNEFIRDKHPDEAAKYAENKNEGVHITFTEGGECLKSTEPSRSDGVNKLLQIFRQDAEKAVVTLRDTYTNNDMKLFTTTVHAMKSALANIGEKELSELAEKLENAGRSGDNKYVSSTIEAFISNLEGLITKLKPAGNSKKDSDIVEDISLLEKQCKTIKAACADYDDTAVYQALDLLNEKEWKEENVAKLDKIHQMLYFDSDYEGVMEFVDKLYPDN